MISPCSSLNFRTINFLMEHVNFLMEYVKEYVNFGQVNVEHINVEQVNVEHVNVEHVKEYVNFLMDFLMVYVEHVKEYVVLMGHFMVHRYGALFTKFRGFLTTGYNIELFMLLFLFMFMLFMLFMFKSNKKSRVITMKPNGYAIMSCSNGSCGRIATYGFSRGGIGSYCDKHYKRNLVKVFGCETHGCRGRVVNGTIMCKRHV